MSADADRKCTKGSAKPCRNPASGVPRGQWCCVCHGYNECAHAECRRPWTGHSRYRPRRAADRRAGRGCEDIGLRSRDARPPDEAVDRSEHIYPLVAALGEAGYEGAGYEISRANLGTLLERANKAEAERDAAQADAAAMRAALEWALGHDECFHDESGGDPSEDGDSAMAAAMRAAIAGTAGRALAARVPLWRELEANLHSIREVHDDACKVNGELCWNCRMSIKAGRARRERTP